MEVQAAWLFDRPTPLDGEDGLRNWYRMFRKAWLDSLPPAEQETILAQAETRLRGELRHDGRWWADYRRIRVVAVKAK